MISNSYQFVKTYSIFEEIHLGTYLTVIEQFICRQTYDRVADGVTIRPLWFLRCGCSLRFAKTNRIPNRNCNRNRNRNCNRNENPNIPDSGLGFQHFWSRPKKCRKRHKIVKTSLKIKSNSQLPCLIVLDFSQVKYIIS